MVQLGRYHLNSDQICVDVPNLIDIVTSRLTIDTDVVFAQLSKERDRPRRTRRKRDPRTGLCLPTGKEQTTETWCNWPAMRNSKSIQPKKPDCPRRLRKKRDPRTGRYLPAKKEPMSNWRATQNLKSNRFVTFINEVTDNVRELTSEGKWQKKEDDLFFVEKPRLLGSSTDLNEVPDFALVERRHAGAKGQSPTWKDVICVGSLKNNHRTDLGEAVTELGEFARRCFCARTDHRFILGLVFFISDPNMPFRLLGFDRTGTLCSEQFDIFREPLEFLRGVVCLPLLPLFDLGWDPTLLKRDDGTYLRVADKDYKILQNIFCKDMVNGNGTCCYQVLGPDGKLYAARDSWVLRSDNFREAEFLDLIKDMKNVPRIVSQDIVKINPEGDDPFLDNTERMWSSLVQKRHEIACGKGSANKMWMKDRWTPQIRDHVRTIISPYGQRLKDFASLSELVSAVLDVFETVEELNERGMLHSDISPGNIILVPTEGSTLRKGFLIDFETAVMRGSEKFVAIDYFTTEMASPEILVHGAERTALHEAESILYVLLFTALYQGGPEGKKREDYDASFFDQAVSTDHYPYRNLDERKAIAKKEIMHNAEYFASEVLDEIDPYFEPLKICLARLRDAIFSASEERLNTKKIYALPTDEFFRRIEEWKDQGIRTALKTCKEILHDTLTTLTGTKESDQLICVKPDSPPVGGDQAEGESKPIGEGQRETEKRPIETVIGASGIEDKSCPSLVHSGDASDKMREDTPLQTSSEAPPSIRKALKRPLPETEDTNQHVDVGYGISTKRRRLSAAEMDADT